MYLVFEIIGTIAFALSGAMVAIGKKMDILGITILGVTTATGGGIIRDLLIGSTPPTALVHPLYPLIAVITSLVIFIPGIRKYVHLDSVVWILIDALGLGTFTVLGCQTAIPFHNIWLQIFLGVLTGVGGGVLRDVFAAEMPIIFVKHLYAVASLLGAIIYSCLLQVNENLAVLAGILSVVVLRMLAARNKWNLPRA